MNLKGELGVPLARLVQLVTEVVLVNNTAKTIDITCPAGKRWRLLSMILVNKDDVDRGVTVQKYLEPAKTNLITRLFGETITAASFASWPSYSTDIRLNTLGQGGIPEILDAGNTLACVWAAGGASAGVTDADGLVIEYLEIDYP